MNTPWGIAQRQEQYADGITWVSTASHGGFRVSAEKLEQMPAAIRAIRPFAGIGWYEEDCDWALVCAAFPDAFPAASCYHAMHTLSQWHPGLNDFLTGSGGEKMRARAAEYKQTSKGKYLRGSYCTNGKETTILATHIDTREQIIVVFKSGSDRDLPSEFTRAEALALGAEIK